MRNLKLQPYTIIMTIGPSHCGKSFFCQNILIPFLYEQNIKYKYLSSDDMRRNVLCDETIHKHNSNMMNVSKQAFSILENLLDNYTQYPVNIPIIIVDATHLSKMGRQGVMKIANKNHYNIVACVFDYKNRDDYFKFADESVNKRIIVDMIKKLKTETLKDLDKKDFQDIIKIPSNNFENEISFSYNNSLETRVFSYEKVCIVGDLHGCLNELLVCILDNKGIEYNSITNKLTIIDPTKYVHHILVGDLVDKGPKVKELIEFIYENASFFTIVKGNHEHWDYEYLKGRLKQNEETEKLINGWFDSVKLFEQDEELKNKFFSIVENSIPYFQTKDFIVTHAPCLNKYLGKNDAASLKAQRNFRYPKREDFETEELYLDSREKEFDFLLKEGEANQPLHIFGHTPVPIVFKNNNKVCIDTGCVMGNFLGVINIDSAMPLRYYIQKYPSQQQKSKESIIPYFRLRNIELPFTSLEWEVQNRVKWAADNKVNFISGTMSPCDKFENDIENLEWGLDYYKRKGAKKIILQPKFMGSRCQVLLHKTNIGSCKAFSRGAYQIRTDRLNSDKTLDELFSELQKTYAYLFDEYNATTILFDGELLPWTVMGKSLIDKDFILPLKACETETNLLKDTSFESLFVEYSPPLSYETKEKEEWTKKQLALIDTVKTEYQFSNQVEEGLKRFRNQLDIFAKEGELNFKPFSILKVIKQSGEEESFLSSNHSNIVIYKKIKADFYAIVDLENDIRKCIVHSDNDFWESNIETFWIFVTRDHNMEGVVIKPEQVYIPNVAPYLKCRNKEYLRLVYGPDYDLFETKYKKLLKKKSIKRKLQTSITEWELGKKLLAINMKDISINNDEWVSTAVRLMEEQEKEKELDPRL